MDRSVAISRLEALTDTLKPVGSSSLSDLEEARAAIAASLLHNPSDLSPPSGDLKFHAEKDTVNFEGIVDRAASLSGSVPLAFRRSVPFQSVTDPSSVPPQTAGMAAKTLGPFVDANGQLHWIDLFPALKQTEIFRANATTPFLLLPLALPHGPLPTTFVLGKGSVWIESQTFAPTAPSGGYTGLTISGGTIKFSSVPTLVSGELQISAGDIVTLTVTLDAPKGPTGGTGLGSDGGAVVLSFPNQVSFTFGSGGGVINAASDAELTIYGTKIPMTWHAATPLYDPTISQILVEFRPLASDFSIGSAFSTLFKLQGKAAVIGAGWALPVAITAPAQLGAASGDGALVIVLGSGLTAMWSGLSGGPAPLSGAFLFGEAGGLELFAPLGRNTQLAEHITLWPEAAPPSTRRSSLDLTFPKNSVVFFTSIAKVGSVTQTEAMTCEVGIEAHLDRPLGADGGRLGPTLSGSVLVFETPVKRGVVVSGKAFAPPPPTPTALALTNALLTVLPADSLLLVAVFSALPTDLAQGRLLLGFPVIRLWPILPDPYAANILPSGDKPEPRPGNESLVAGVSWAVKGRASMAFSLTPSDLNALFPAAATLTAISSVTPDYATITQQNLAEQDQAWLTSLVNLFHETIGGEPATFFLLDVSSNADQFGVGIAPTPGTLEPGSPSLQIDGMNVVGPANSLRVFTVPQVQWEPVVNIPNQNAPFPSPVAFQDDGGPTMFGSSDVTLVPVAPAPVLDRLLSAYEGGEVTAAVLFTLPFGMKAVATLPKRSIPHPVGIFPPSLSSIRPNFNTKTLSGGRQISLMAGVKPEFPGGPSPSLPGATVQLRNLVDRTGNPSVPPLSILGPSVDQILNNELVPGKPTSCVPVTRIDFSGYGESTFSEWVDPSASPPAVTKAHFDVIVGRTSREVVQVKSILYPWGAIVVRTITIERQDNAEVTRSDSGWIAATPGVFNLSGITVHPGVVHGAFNIREIRDTTQVYQNGQIEMTAVYFDADIKIDNVTSGARNGLVPSVGQLGFVLTAGIPDQSGFPAPLTPSDLAALIKTEGALGGPINCTIAVAGTTQPMRVARVEFSTAPNPNTNTDEFAAIARGSLTLPAQGSWSVVKLADSAGEPQAIDPDLGLPLIREGPVGSTPTSPFRFAEAADLLLTTPSMDYALLHSTSSTRVLFPRPKIETGSTEFTSTVTPLLADGFALMEAVGIAPRQDTCLVFPDANYQLQIGGPGVLTLENVANPFPPSRPSRTLATGTAATIGLDYDDNNGTQCKVSVAISPTQWSIHLKGLNVRLDMGPFPGLMYTVGDMLADSTSGVSFANPNLILGSVLAPLEDILSSPPLSSFPPFTPTPFAVAFSNSGWSQSNKYKMKAGRQEKLSVDTPIGTFKIGLKTGYGNVASKESALFTGTAQWLAYFNFKGELQVPVYPEVKVGGLVVFKMEVDFPTGSTPETDKLTLQLGVIVTVGGDLVPGVVKLQASVSFAFMLVVVTSPSSSIGVGIALILDAKGQILSGLVGITFTAEADGLYINNPKEIQATFKVQVDVSLCWCLDVDFQVQSQYTKALS